MRSQRLDLLTVFVGAGEEPGVVAEQAIAARKNVADDRRVGVADVGARVDVINRRGDVIFVGFGHGELRSRLDARLLILTVFAVFDPRCSGIR
jgi:hypothetical protein